MLLFIDYVVSSWYGERGNLILYCGTRLSQLGMFATIWFIVLALMIDDDCEAIGGMRIGVGNGNTRRTSAPVPLLSPHIPRD
jgi:hypothetical protein